MTYLVIPIGEPGGSIHDADVIADFESLREAHDFIDETDLGRRVQICALTASGRRRFLSAAELLKRNRMISIRED